MIRLAKSSDLSRILTIYSIARQYMIDTGNTTQWKATHPSVEMLENDIAVGQLYVIEENNVVHGVFAFIIGEDPTYTYIENGAWLNNQPYGTIHRIASSGEVKGMFDQCLSFCKEKMDTIRIDTHENNHTMQHLILKNGFKQCGIIYISDGSPRIAYQYAADEPKEN